MDEATKQPECGVDFCEQCGDCLHCYGEEDCYYGGKHHWLNHDDDGNEINDQANE